MAPDIHNAKSVDDAVNMLDTRIPLLHQEIYSVAESLYDNAFREGARQGRLAGVEAERKRLRDIAKELVKSENATTRGVGDSLMRLTNPVAASEAREAAEGEREYRDTTDVIREHLARKARG